ncbi:putative MFS drug transporter [Wallemia mellicola]|nr:putative MFS drug transporter [Wallemia mellicola]
MDRDQNSSVHRKFIISLPISPSSHFIKIDSESDNSIKKDIINEDSLARSFYSIFPFAAYLRLFPDKRTDAEKQITDQTNYLPKSRIIMVFIACSSVDFLALMDQTNVAVALNTIASSLGSGSQSSWIASAYFLTSTSFQLLYGRFSDICGRKTILMIGLFIFFVFTLGSSLSQTMTQLIVFRALTGMGGGGLMSLCQVIVSDVVSLRDRGKYQGILGAVVALANGVGPVLGGAFASFQWRWIFWLNLPICAVTSAMVWFIMPLKKVEGSWKEKLFRIDFFGAFLTLLSTTLIILGLTWAGSEYPWDSAHVLGTLISGIGVAIIFIAWEGLFARIPVMPLYIFRCHRMVNGACLTQFINGYLFLTQTYYLPKFYQLAYGYSGVKSGAMLLPLSLVQTASSTLGGLLVTWIGRYREIVLLGWALWATGMGLLSTLDDHTGVDKQVGYSILTGFGVGLTLQASLVGVQAAVERKDMAVITSVRNFVRNLGGTLGLAISGTTLNTVFRSRMLANGLSESLIKTLINNPEEGRNNLDEDTTDLVISGYRQGFRIIFLTCAGLGGLSFILAFLLMPQISLDRDDDQKLKDEGRKWVEEGKNKKRMKKEGIKDEKLDTNTRG